MVWLKPPLLRRFPPVACSVTVPSGAVSPWFVRPASSKTGGVETWGDKASLTRRVSSSIALTCSSTCACVAFGLSKTALAAARPASTSSWSAFMELRVSFSNKACRLPWVLFATVLSATDLACSCSFPAPPWEVSWAAGFVSGLVGTRPAVSCPLLASSLLVSGEFDSPVDLSSAGCPVWEALSGSSPSESCLSLSGVPADPATTSLAVARDTSGACACTPFAKNINAATATLAAPKWYLRIE